MSPELVFVIDLAPYVLLALGLGWLALKVWPEYTAIRAAELAADIVAISKLEQERREAQARTDAHDEAYLKAVDAQRVVSTEQMTASAQQSAAMVQTLEDQGSSLSENLAAVVIAINKLQQAGEIGDKDTRAALVDLTAAVVRVYEVLLARAATVGGLTVNQAGSMAGAQSTDQARDQAADKTVDQAVEKTVRKGRAK